MVFAMKLQLKTNSQIVAALKKEVIAEVQKYCKLLNNGYSDFCY